VLFFFGTGPIKGFAVTLSIGIVASMFTAILVTRYLLKLLVRSNLTKNLKLFGL
jgi:preprotein translocase subunit SecD